MGVYQISPRHRIFKANCLFSSDWRSVLLAEQWWGGKANKALLYACVTGLTGGLKMEPAAQEKAPFFLCTNV